MRKAELVTNISEKTGISKVDVLLTLATFFEEVKNTLAEDENVYIRGFGSFVVVKRSTKKARNIRKNTEIIVPEHCIPHFRPSKVFMDKVKENVKPNKDEN